ncbi:MAG: ABC transporter ATP-binding protein [Elusimicrobia bacterium]|nr:ABC transporter ATP-binding protein [Elusimicrobiota bacterium]
MSAPVITFRSVTKNYTLYHELRGGIKNFLFRLPKAIKQIRDSSYCVLKDISFEVGSGETLGIIGRNGAGKSTLLGLMAGILRPSAGEVEVNGRITPLLELGGGFHPDLTGIDNIMLNGVLLGLSRKAVTRKLSEIIKFADIGDYIGQPIRTYSSGMVARLGFSVAAHLDPEIILADELLAVGDADFNKKCLDKMSDFKRSGVTIVFISHSMESIRKICDRVIWIEGHKIKMAGDAGAVTGAYKNSRPAI